MIASKFDTKFPALLCLRLSVLHILAYMMVLNLYVSLATFKLCATESVAQILPTRASQILLQNL